MYLMKQFYILSYENWNKIVTTVSDAHSSMQSYYNNKKTDNIEIPYIFLTVVKYPKTVEN